MNTSTPSTTRLATRATSLFLILFATSALAQTPVATLHGTEVTLHAAEEAPGGDDAQWPELELVLDWPIADGATLYLRTEGDDNTLAETVASHHLSPGDNRLRTPLDPQLEGTLSVQLVDAAGVMLDAGTLDLAALRAGHPSLELPFSQSPGASASDPAPTSRVTGGDILDLQWETVYGTPDEPQGPAIQGFQYGPAGLTLSPDGEVVYMGGFERTMDGVDFGVVVATSSTGERLWVTRVESMWLGNGGWRQEAIAVSSDGSRVFATGFITGSRGEQSVLTIAFFDAETGEEVWRDAWDASDTWDWGFALDVSPDGARVYVTGKTGENPDRTIVAAYAAATGQREWAILAEDAPGSSYNLIGLHVRVSHDGERVYVASNGSDFACDRNTVLAAYDTDNGDEIWRAVFGDSDNPNGCDWGGPWHLMVSPDDERVYVTSRTGYGALVSSTRYFDFWTFAYDAMTGEEVWDARYRGPYGGSQENPGDNTPNTLSATDDVVLVSGFGPELRNNREFAFATVAYDAASGKELWADRFDSNSDAEAASNSAVSPDGSVLYVTGGDAYLKNSDTISRNTVLAYDVTTGERLSEVQGFDDPFYDKHWLALVAAGPGGDQVFVASGSGSSQQGQETGDGMDFLLAAYGEGTIGTEDDPAAFRLSNVAPNPASGSTTPTAWLTLRVPEAQTVTARIYDTLGRLVQTVHDGALTAGQETRLEIATAGLAAGAYVVRVEGESFAETRRFAIVR